MCDDRQPGRRGREVDPLHEAAHADRVRGGILAKLNRAGLCGIWVLIPATAGSHLGGFAAIMLLRSARPVPDVRGGRQCNGAKNDEQDRSEI